MLRIPEIPAETGQLHHFHVDVEGPIITAIIDGFSLFSYQDYFDPYWYGFIALEAYSGGIVQWQDAYFDNVRVDVFVIPAAKITWGHVKNLYR